MKFAFKRPLSHSFCFYVYFIRLCGYSGLKRLKMPLNRIYCVLCVVVRVLYMYYFGFFLKIVNLLMCFLINDISLQKICFFISLIMEITGKVRQILPEQRFAGRNGEVVRYGFVIDTLGQYSHAVCFNVLGVDRWSKLSPNIQVGADIQVSFDVSSREWSGRWFTQCDAYRVSVVNSGVQPSVIAQPSQPAGGVNVNNSSNNEEMPF